MVVAIDGKTTRGARTTECAAAHLLAAITTGGIVAGQLAAKTSEITALPVLTESLPGDVDPGSPRPGAHQTTQGPAGLTRTMHERPSP